MTRIMDLLSDKLLPIADKIGSQRHLQAIRNGLLAMLPLTIVGSFFTVLTNLPIAGYTEFITPFLHIVDVPFRFTVGLMALYAGYTIASSLSIYYKLNQTTGGMLGLLATFLMIMPANLLEGVDKVHGAVAAGRYLPIGQLGSQGLFGAIIAGLLSIEIYRIIIEKNWVIKMPDSVPPAVADSFSALLPTLVIIIVFWVPRHFFNFNINDILVVMISPLKSFLTGNNLLGGIITQLLITIFWSLGIHGHAVLGPVIRPFWDQAILENAELFASGVSEFDLPNVFTEQFYQWYAQMGGTGATLALVCLMVFSRSSYYKQLGKLSFVPALFNINEPIIFGMPIVMNPILMIPFILAPIANTVLIYTVTTLDFMPRMMMKPPFSIPAPLGALLTSNWNLFAFAMVFVSFLLSLAIYYPFFKMAEKQQALEESAEGAVEINVN